MRAPLKSSEETNRKDRQKSVDKMEVAQHNRASKAVVISLQGSKTDYQKINVTHRHKGHFTEKMTLPQRN